MKPHYQDSAITELEYAEEPSLEDASPIIKAKFGSGFTVTTANESFSIQIRGRFQGLMQVEHQYNSDESAKFGAQVRRARLKIEGFVGKAKHTESDAIAGKYRMGYNVQIGYSNRDITGIADGGGILLDAFISYSPCENLEILAGQAKLPGNREFLTSTQNQQFIDRSATSIFSIERDFGIQFKGDLGENFVFQPTFSIASGEGRNQTGLHSSGLDYTIRTDFLPLGDFKGAFEMGDIRREPEPKLAFAAAYDANHNARYENGQRGGDEVAGEDRTSIHTIFADAIFKYKGLSVFGEYSHRTVGEDYRDSYTTGNAVTTSIGYVCEKMFEVAFRYARAMPLDNLDRDSDMRTGTNFYTIGASKYFKGYDLKIQTDYTITDPVNGDLAAGLFRLQFEVAF